MKNRSFMRMAAPLLLLGLVFWGLASCSSDAVAPQDKLPPLSEESAIFQAGYAAFYVANAYGIYQGYLSKKKAPTETDLHTFGGSTGASGSFRLTYFCGVMDCLENDADRVLVLTEPDTDQAIAIRNSSSELLAEAFFDVEVTNYVGTPDGQENGDVTGTGQLKVGEDFTTDFTFDNVHLSHNEYPESGTLTYEPGTHDVMVTFNGTHEALLQVGEDDYTVDLDDGEVEPVVPTE